MSVLGLFVVCVVAAVLGSLVVLLAQYLNDQY